MIRHKGLFGLAPKMSVKHVCVVLPPQKNLCMYKYTADPNRSVGIRAAKLYLGDYETLGFLKQ